MKHAERDLQTACINWFRMQYPHLRWLLFAIPNGGSRNVIEAANLKRSGVLAGVADTFLAVPRNCYHGLFVEFKSGKGKQTEAQATFEKEVVNQGYDYKVARSSDEFIDIIKKYLR